MMFLVFYLPHCFVLSGGLRYSVSLLYTCALSFSIILDEFNIFYHSVFSSTNLEVMGSNH